MANLARLPGLKEQARKAGWLGWIRSEADERAVLEGCWFNLQRAEKVVDFFPTFLCHFKGRLAGKPFELLEWQREELIMPLFGWEIVDEFGAWVRRYTKAYVELPKKNGKSTLASGVGLYMLTADGEPGAQIYSAATDKKQAGIVHGDAMSMVDASEPLSDLLDINRSTNQITFPATNSFYRALSALPRSNEGWDAHCIIADELHMWYGRKLYDALRWAFAARSQPLFFQITTAGDDTQSVCYEQHEYAEKILSGTETDLRFFPLLKCADPKEDDISDEEVWHKANPSLGVTIGLKGFRDDYEEAAKSPSSLDAWKRYRLNIWTTGESVWLDYRKWCKAGTPFDIDELRGRPCWGGLDLAKTRDTTSLQLIFPWPETGKFRLLSFFWLPEETARAENHRVSYLEWGKDDLIFLTPGPVCDYGFVKKKIGELSEIYAIKNIFFDDRYAEQLTQDLELEFEIPRTNFPQTLGTFCGPTAEFERLHLIHAIEHRGHKVMDWQVSNAKVYSDCNNNKRPVKPGPDDHRKIDGVVAAIMALAAVLDGDADEPSIYDTPNDDRTCLL